MRLVNKDKTQKRETIVSWSKREENTKWNMMSILDYDIQILKNI